MRLAFAGTPEFAGTALTALLAAGDDVALVLTQPDRPAGRGMKAHPSPVKVCAVEHRLALAQPRSLRLDGRFPEDASATREALLAARPDVLVVAAYGLILPQWLLELPRLGCVNIHASLLPRWRGAAPIQRAIEAGDSRTGITIMQMDAGLDTGDMLLVESMPIGPDDTATTLLGRLSGCGARLIVRTLELAESGGLTRTPQPAEGITYASKIDKAEADVDWSAPAATLERRLRAFDPFPGASSQLEAEIVKLWRGAVTEGSGAPGEILRAGDAGVVVACGDGALSITQLQRPGGRRISAAQFAASGRVMAGLRFRSPD